MTADMTLPDDGLLQAYIDDELAEDDRSLVEHRLAADPVWASALDELTQASDVVSRGLAAQDRTPPSVAGPPPWIGVLKQGARTAPSRFPMGRAAAVVVLVTGAVASGLPGSPVREWFADRFAEPPAQTRVPMSDVIGLDEPVPADTEDVGVRVSTPAGAVLVVLPDLPPGVELRVRLNTDGEMGVFGPSETSFRARDGRVDVLNPAGVIRVDLPTGLNQVTILVGAAVYLRKDLDSMNVLGPVTSRTDTEIRFEAVPAGS